MPPAALNRYIGRQSLRAPCPPWLIRRPLAARSTVEPPSLKHTLLKPISLSWYLFLCLKIWYTGAKLLRLKDIASLTHCKNADVCLYFVRKDKRRRRKFCALFAEKEKPCGAAGPELAKIAKTAPCSSLSLSLSLVVQLFFISHSLYLSICSKNCENPFFVLSFSSCSTVHLIPLSLSLTVQLSS